MGSSGFSVAHILLRPQEARLIPRVQKWSLSIGAAASMMRGLQRKPTVQKSNHFAFGRYVRLVLAPAQ